jgi:hypothetical protein
MLSGVSMKLEYFFIVLLVVQSNGCMELKSISQSMDHLSVDSSSSDLEARRRMPPFKQLKNRRLIHKRSGGSPWCKRIGYSAFMVTTWVLILTLWHFGTETNGNLVDLRGELQRDRSKIDDALRRFDVVQGTCETCVTAVGQVRSYLISVPEEVLAEARACGTASQRVVDSFMKIREIVD